MKFRAHDTFFIRKGWLSKGMKNVELKPNVFVDNSENPMDVLGIGANMVKALRYWLQAVGLTKEPKAGKKVQTFTEFGKLLYSNDRFFEETGSIFLLQYMLASNLEDATSWYFFFNEFSMTEFTKDDFVAALQRYITINNGNEVAVRSLNDDFTCITNTYMPRHRVGTRDLTPENNIECPFGELGLLDYSNKARRTYRKTSPDAEDINPWILLAVITNESKGKKEITLSELLNGKCNIGRVFNLDTVTMLTVLHKLELMKEIKIVRTAGLDTVTVTGDYSFADCIAKYYDSID